MVRRSRAKQRRIDRLNVLRYGFIGAAVLIIVRLFLLQVVNNGYYEALASDNHKLFQVLVPERGDIVVQDLYNPTGISTIATNKQLAEIHIDPRRVTDLKSPKTPQQVAEELSPILHLPVTDLVEQINRPTDPDEILMRRAPAEIVETVSALNLPGINFRYEQWRYYPEGEYTAHVTGYYGYSDDSRKGQYGLEGYFEDQLAGKPGYIDGEKDGLGRFLTLGESSIAEATDGVDLELTLDKNVQFFACDRLKNKVEELSAKEGSLIVLEPKTGAIIAMCNYPSYDPNYYNQVESVDVFINSAVSDEYEPGSVMKGITMAAGLDQGVVTPSSTYTDTGEVVIDGRPITNFDGKTYGVRTMTEVLENSLNLGALFVTDQLGNERFYHYLQDFGFGETSGIELAGEHNGDISQVAELRRIYSATASYGHGLTVTPLQMTMAYGALANNGKLMKPYIVAKELLPDGTSIVTQPQVRRQVISTETARTIGAMLVSVVDNGHAKKAQVPGYFIAGKTGTALVATSAGYDEHRHNDTFVGYGPVSDPQFVLLVKINEPQGVQYAEGSVVAIWGEIAQFLVNYYHIPPDRTE